MGLLSTANNMQMQMKHHLTTIAPGVYRGSETAFQTMLLRYFWCKQQEFAQQFRMAIVCCSQRINVQFGDQQEVHGSDRIDVMKCIGNLIFIHLFAGYFTFDYFTEDTVIHVQSFFLLAFSVMPDTPSRLASSCSTSSIVKPCCASSTMQWNSKSAVS